MAKNKISQSLPILRDYYKVTKCRYHYKLRRYGLIKFLKLLKNMFLTLRINLILILVLGIQIH